MRGVRDALRRYPGITRRAALWSAIAAALGLAAAFQLPWTYGFRLPAPTLEGIAILLAAPLAGVAAYWADVAVTRRLEPSASPEPPATPPEPDYSWWYSRRRPPFLIGAPWPAVASFVLLVILGEELARATFVGAVVWASGSLVWGWLLSSLAFGLAHFAYGWYATPGKAVTGAILGGLLVLSGSVLPPLFAHATFNWLTIRYLRREWARAMPRTTLSY